MANSEAKDCFYQRLHQKINEFDFTVISFVPDEPENDEHAAFAFTIGLSNLGCPELFFADIQFNDVKAFSKHVLSKVKQGIAIKTGDEMLADKKQTPARLIELEDGIKEKMMAQAQHYFDIYSPEHQYEALYVGFSDEFGIFPDDKIFIPSKIIQKQFYKSSARVGMFGSKNLVSHTSSLMN